MKAIVNRVVLLAVVLLLPSLRGAAQQVPAAPRYQRGARDRRIRPALAGSRASRDS